MILPAILDIEASGFGRGSYPVEIAVIDENRECRHWLIQPESEWTHWNVEAEGLHQISRQILLDEGTGIHAIADQLNEWLEGQIIYSDGWGVDSGWLALLYHHANKTMTFRLETLTRMLSEFQLAHWDETKKNIRLRQGFGYHRASTDAELLQLTYEATVLAERQSGLDRTLA